MFSFSDFVIKLLPASDKSETILEIKSSFVKRISLRDSPMLTSSEAFKTFDRKLILSLLLFSVIKFILSFLSVLILSLIASTSAKSITPSSFASRKLPFTNWLSKFFWIMLSSILLAWIKVSLTLFTSFNSVSVTGLLVKLFSWSTETASSVLKIVFNSFPVEISIRPTMPKLSSDKTISEIPFSWVLILSLVPLMTKFVDGNFISILPLFFLAIDPDSIIAKPFLITPKKIFLVPEILNVSTWNEEFCLSIIVELSLYCMVTDDWTSVKTSSPRKISS